MAEILTLEHTSLQKTGPTLTVALGPGQSLCVVGPARAGKSRLINVMSGREQPVRGRVQIGGRVAVADPISVSRRIKPQSLIDPAGGSNRATLTTEVLTATGLWDVRQEPVTDLSPSQIAACELIEPLSSRADLLVIDGQLDRLDPWALQSTMSLLRQRTTQGAALVVATNRADLIQRFDTLVVLHSSEIRFAGSVPDLLRSGPPTELTVETDNQPGVRAIVNSFEVTIRETEDGVHIQAAQGQQIASKLLLEGYGDVRSVVLRAPTIEDALVSLLSARPSR